MALLLPVYPVNFQEAIPIRIHNSGYTAISKRIQLTGKSGKLRKTRGSCLGRVTAGPCFSAAFWISL